MQVFNVINTLDRKPFSYIELYNKLFSKIDQINQNDQLFQELDPDAIFFHILSFFF
jgi:hypothetical protein